MRIINIPSIWNLEQVRSQEKFLALAHLVKKYPTYAAWVKRFSDNGGYVILDNGVIETGKPANIESLLECADIIHADEIILPDVYQENERTLAYVDNSLSYLQRNYGGVIPYKIMAVAQGITQEEIKKCIDLYDRCPNIDVIGIPKHLALLPGGRPSFEPLWQDTSKEIHLLGIWYSYSELLIYEHPEKIRSVDSGLYNQLILAGKKNVFANRPTEEKYKLDLENTFIGDIEYEIFMNRLDERSILRRIL